MKNLKIVGDIYVNEFLIELHDSELKFTNNTGKMTIGKSSMINVFGRLDEKALPRINWHIVDENEFATLAEWKKEDIQMCIDILEEEYKKYCDKMLPKIDKVREFLQLHHPKNAIERYIKSIIIRMSYDDNFDIEKYYFINRKLK